jgi:alanine-synthesizing transaminase
VDEEFYRMKRLPPYVIAEVNAMRAAARAAGRTSSTSAWATPICRRPPHVIDKLCEVARKPDAHGYSASSGIPGVRRRRPTTMAAGSASTSIPKPKSSSRWAQRKASPALPPQSPRRATSFSRPTPATRSTPSASSSPAPPSAPCPPRPMNAIRIRSTARCAITVPRPSVLVVNYPSNPTAETVDLPFYERLVAWARENKVWILSDLAYSELYFDGKPTRSILEVHGAKDVAIEFTSLSKTYSMAGWRVGFAVGNKKLIAAMTRVKSYLDYGAFTPIQAAACAALNGPQDIVEANRQLYHKRRDVLVEAFGRAGWDIPSPRASMFAWAPLPPALNHLGSLEFSKQLLTHAGVAVAPGVGYGEEGEGFVRIAMVENEQRLRQAARNMRKYLQSMGVNSSAA